MSDMMSLLVLLTDLRCALGDNGLRMQPELVEYARELKAKADEADRLRAELDIATHKVICCGVAASHPDPGLTTSGAYADKWDSPQAEAVRALRRERDSLRALANPPRTPGGRMNIDDEVLCRARRVAAEQAEDEGLWFDAETATEAYLQAALRRLAAVVEGEPDPEAA